MRSRLAARARAWLVRWRPVLPLLIAEFIIVVGFGALLPVLPLYVVDQDAACRRVVHARRRARQEAQQEQLERPVEGEREEARHRQDDEAGHHERPA